MAQVLAILFVTTLIYGVIMPLMNVYFANANIKLDHLYQYKVKKIEEKYNVKSDSPHNDVVAQRIPQNQKKIKRNWIICGVSVTVCIILVVTAEILL